MSEAKIKVTGLKEFQKALRAMDRALPKQIRLVLNDAATVVIREATSRMPSRTGRAKNSVKARSNQRESRVAIGGARAPYVPWLDFGGKTGPGGKTVRPFYREGRYLYPALRLKHDEVTEIMEKGLTALAQGAGVEVTDG